ncbi:MAG: hypothetical protein ABIS67_13540 [Candidatus Eisenbacteria bacterium]
MRARTTTQYLLAVFAFGATVLVSDPFSIAAATESRAWNRVPAAPTVAFSITPRWEVIPGTRVSWVRQQERPNYDLFRYGSRYYIYNDGYWYRSDRLNRRFTVIDERYIPIAFADVPTRHWRSYPPGWKNPKNPHYSGRHDNSDYEKHDHGKNNDKSRGKGSH